MVDYEKIGKRIYEERKHIQKLSQEKMAEELGLYQADISNLEKAKSGSGITDLSKLDLIAEYLGMPLETLIFGQEGKNMPVYFGETMKLKQSKKKMKKSHGEKLLNLLGAPDGAEVSSLGKLKAYTCGPYDIYCPGKALIGYDHNTGQQYMIFYQLYFYVFFGNEIAAIMVTDKTFMMQHIYQPALTELQKYIPHVVLDVTDPLRTINPYWALYQFTSDEESDQYFTPMLKRMDEIRAVAQEDSILYIENLYVREDFRRKGISRMLMDLLKTECGDCITWLNMEPTSGSELEKEYGNMPIYTAAELGQLNINAAIAERLGFTVDPDTWRRQAEILDDEGYITTEVIEVRKCAYKIPKKIKQIIKNDGDLVALGRAKQKLLQKDDEGHSEIDVRTGRNDEYIIQEVRISYIGGADHGKTVFVYGAISETMGKMRYGVSVRSALDCGLEHKGIMEEYENLDDATDSEYLNELQMVDAFLSLATNKEGFSGTDMCDDDCQYSLGADKERNCIV